MNQDEPVYFSGTIPNESGTPRNEVGGLALFNGVLMRSRTGFAIALRLANGAVQVRQIPFASLRGSKAWRLPLLRGAASLAEMTKVGTQALGYSAAIADGRAEQPQSPAAMKWMLTASAAAMIAMLVLAPDILAVALLAIARTASPGSVLNETDEPLLFNLLAGAFRLALLGGYVGVLTMQSEIRTVFEYHGAEHQAALALEDGRDVTVARARSHGTLHPRCGTTFLALVAMLCIFAFALCDYGLTLYLSGYPSWSGMMRRAIRFASHVILLPVVVGLAFELIKIACAHRGAIWARVMLWPGMALQRFTTRTPSDQQREVAIIALLGALAISPSQQEIRTYNVRGLENDDSAPGYVATSPARPAPPINSEPVS
ncbi:DUF1385 domain-containing protein [soil metagenome]